MLPHLKVLSNCQKVYNISLPFLNHSSTYSLSARTCVWLPAFRTSWLRMLFLLSENVRMDVGLPTTVCLVRIPVVAGSPVCGPPDVGSDKPKLCQRSDRLLSETYGHSVWPGPRLCCLGVSMLLYVQQRTDKNTMSFSHPLPTSFLLKRMFHYFRQIHCDQNFF